MRPLAHAALSVLLSMALIGTLCTAFLLTRLQPWWGSVPGSVLWPLARALLFHAFEWTALLAVPLGLGWSCVGPFLTKGLRARVVTAAPVLLAVALLQWGVLSRGYRESEAPGQLVQRLVAEARESCLEQSAPQIVIPIVGLTWTCLPAPPRISGKIDPAAFSADGLEPSNDLRSFKLLNLSLTLTSKDFPKTTLRVRQASISGLSSWGRPTTNQFGGRVPFVVVSTAALGWIALRLAARLAFGRRWLGAIAGFFVALLLVLAYLRLDQLNSPGWHYWCLPAAWVAVSELLLWLAERVRFPR